MYNGNDEEYFYTMFFNLPEDVKFLVNKLTPSRYPWHVDGSISQQHPEGIPYITAVKLREK